MTETPVPEPIGPVEFLILTFPGNPFAGDIAPAIDELLRTGQVRIIDMAVVSKDADDTVTILEAQELSPEVAAAFEKLGITDSGLLSEADLDEVAISLAPGSAAAALLIEHVWATRFALAVRSAKGELVLAERIPPEIVAEARAGLLAAAAAAV